MESNYIGNNIGEIEVEFLGTGTSTGVPQLDCTCKVCRSNDPRDRRMRTSALVYVKGKTILIDCGPDFRQQMLNANLPHIDAVLLTHSHYDHVGGLDELRSLTAHYDVPIYCCADVQHDIMARLPYCFKKHLYPGVAKLDLHLIDPRNPFYAAGVMIQPLQVMHYKLPIVGFRIGDFSYITDAKTIPDETMALLRGTRYLVLNSLRIREHFSHMSLSESLDIISKVAPEISYLIHLNHDMGLYAEISTKLPENVKIATDGLRVKFRQ